MAKIKRQTNNAKAGIQKDKFLTKSVMTEVHNHSISKLRDLLSKDDNVLLAFVFGSLAANRQKNNSDIDVAVLYENPPSGIKYIFW